MCGSSHSEALSLLENKLSNKAISRVSNDQVAVRLSGQPLGINFCIQRWERRCLCLPFCLGARSLPIPCDRPDYSGISHHLADQDDRRHKVGKHTKANAAGVRLERPMTRIVPRRDFERIQDLVALLEKLFGNAPVELRESV
jgi:hypothetical protein